MAYTSILPKFGICIDCNDGVEKDLIAGRCKAYHYSIYRKKLMLERQREKLKVRSLRHLPANKEIVAKVKQPQSNDLQLWFSYHMFNSLKVCENCGKSLSHYSEIDWRGSQDHIIEKSALNGCPSVATVLENHCVLGKWCCHSQKHTSNLNLSRMPVFPLLKERFVKFEHLIDENEKKKVPKYFYEK